MELLKHRPEVSASSLELVSAPNFLQGEVETGTLRLGPGGWGRKQRPADPWGGLGSWGGGWREAGAHTHAASALMQHRDMLRKELALARVPRAASMPRSRSLVLKMSSIWRGTRLRSWLIWGR